MCASKEFEKGLKNNKKKSSSKTKQFCFNTKTKEKVKISKNVENNIETNYRKLIHCDTNLDVFYLCMCAV
jgi:hypothetical protein